MSSMALKQKQKAEDFLAQAESTRTKKASWFGGGGSKERQYEDAGELYIQAANAYKVGGMNQEAGDTYAKAAEMYSHIKSYNDAAKAFGQAGAFTLLFGLFSF
jgi:alpha-soluble NSF attachment protein